MSKFRVGDRIRIIRADVPIPLRPEMIGREGTIVDKAQFFGEWIVLLDGNREDHQNNVLSIELELLP